MQSIQKQHIFAVAFIVCAVFFIIPCNTSAQTVSIPDPDLRAAINEALDKPKNAAVTRAEMETLTELRANNRDIGDLTGISAAVNLRHLELDDNLIIDLTPLKGLNRLRHLEIANNAISDLSPLAGLIDLRGLAIHHNIISDLSPLAGLTKLEWIGMSDNVIADLEPLSGLISLRNFHGWGTPVINIEGIVHLPRLRELNVCGGEISDLTPLANAKGLTELYLPGNGVTDLSPLAGLTNLKRVSFENNDISDLSPLENLSNLTWIDLHHNQISNVTPLANIRGLTWVDLGENQIADVSPLVDLENLNWLGLNGNTIPDETIFDRFSERTAISHSNFVNTAFPEAGPKIVGPWLWTIVPGSWLEKDTDLIARATKGGGSEIKVATFGATEGKAVGDSEWEAHRLAPTGGDNINEMTDALGWGSGSEIYEHVVYGTVNLNSPSRQETTMLVGSDDGVKVWLNGELVHYNPVARGAGDYQDAFPVTLKQGTNVLLVAVDNRGHGGFSGFFGFAKDTDYTVNPIGKKFTVKIPAWDVNRDGMTDILDLIIVGQDFGKARSANARTDVNRDGKRNIADLVLVARHLGELSGVSAAPAALALRHLELDPTIIRTWITQAQLENDDSLTFQQGIANLQRLLALLIPEKTALLANYPNPFNPETWIPYHLAEPAEVTLRIYTVRGALVRSLHLGHQPAGSYQDRSRAAYWDGKNDVGESVASGVYFYTLSTEATRGSVTAGDFTATRKMLIRK